MFVKTVDVPRANRMRLPRPAPATFSEGHSSIRPRPTEGQPVETSATLPCRIVPANPWGAADAAYPSVTAGHP